jgi:hypothetical protein
MKKLNRIVQIITNPLRFKNITNNYKNSKKVHPLDSSSP